MPAVTRAAAAAATAAAATETPASGGSMLEPGGAESEQRRNEAANPREAKGVFLDKLVLQSSAVVPNVEAWLARLAAGPPGPAEFWPMGQAP